MATWTPPEIDFPGYELTADAIAAIRIGSDRAPSWEHEHSLSLLLHERENRLSAHDWSTIISAIRGRPPLIVTVRENFNGTEFHQKRMLMVEYSIVADRNSANRLRCYSWGFGGSYYYLQDIVAIDTPELGDYVRVDDIN